MLESLSRRDLTYIAEYISATRNEIAIDEKAFAYAGCRAEDVGYIPRPSMWIGRVGRRYRWTRFIASVAILAVRVTGGAPFHAFEALRLARRLGGNDQRVALPSSHMVGLAFSERAPQIVKRSVVADAPDVWVVPPWIDASVLQGPAVGLLRLSSLADIKKAFRLAIIATRRLSAHHETSKWALQCYTSVRWFVVRLALQKLQTSFIIAEHYDRWAVLTDALIRSSRRQHPKSADRKFVLVQHGTVGSLIGRNGSDLGLSYRLTAVNKLYAYGPEAASIFQSDLLTLTCARALDVVFFKQQIALNSRRDPTRPSVLFVGHPLCASVQIEILNRIKQTGINIYYKPHPIAGLPKACRHLKWTIVDQPDMFPEVDLLISYPSTLVEEYRAAGVHAVIHPMSLDDLDVVEIVRKIQTIVPPRPSK